MSTVDVRHGFRLAGISAEIAYLRREGFSGEALYWRDGCEMRRKLLIVEAGTNGDAPRSTRDITAERLDGIFSDWLRHAESELKIFFKVGTISKIER